MKGLQKIIAVCVLISAFIICGLYYLNSAFKTGYENLKGIDFSYFEDTSGRMGVNEADSTFLQGGFTEKEIPSFNFGRSRSAFWIRIFAPNTSALKKYIAVHCPNIQDVKLYVPTDSGYITQVSGWGNCTVRKDEGMTYPVFRLDKNLNANRAVYIREQSDYSLLCTVNFYNGRELSRARTIDYCLNSFLFGILLTIVIINLNIYFILKNKICLIFAICVFFSVIHQGCSTGMYNILLPEHSDVIMSLSIEIGFVFLIFNILFFMEFSEVKIYNPFYCLCLKGLIAACIAGYPFCIADKVAANLYAHVLLAVIPLFILYVSLRLSFLEHPKHRFFLIAWNITTITYVFVTLCTEGVMHLQNNYITVHGALISITVVSTLFMIAMVVYVKSIQIEQLKMQQEVKLASERIKRTEMALMQTQIKPHFLYNTLTAIEQLCTIDSQKAQTAIEDFANYLRSNVDFSTETKLINIEKELKNVRHYLSLEKMRFEERLTVIYDINSCDFMLPPLVVQLIVENAVRHGVTKKPEGGTVKIEVGETETSHIITVSDDGVGFDPESDTAGGRSHIGIRNARDRLSRQCKGTLHISSKIGAGTTVTITIPKEDTQEPDCS